MSEAATTTQPSGSPPQSNNPFVQPVAPARTEADAATARTNAEVLRPDLAEARRQADLLPQQRFEQRLGPTQTDRIGDRKLSDAEYDSLTYSEKQAYAERRTELANKASDPSTSADPSKPADPSTGEKIRLADDLELTREEINGLRERAAIEESRKLTQPADPTGYKLELPKDFVLPQGIEFKFDESGPAVQLAREFAHRNGFSQEQFSRMAAIHAAVEVQKLTQFRDLERAEVEKLGATGSQRVTTVQTFLKAHLGDEIARPFMNTLVMEKQVRGWEMIMQKLSGGASSRYNGGGRGPDDSARISDAAYNQMSYSEKKAYAESASNSNGRR
jgi:hypothetical protein